MKVDITKNKFVKRKLLSVLKTSYKMYGEFMIFVKISPVFKSS